MKQTQPIVQCGALGETRAHIREANRKSAICAAANATISALLFRVLASAPMEEAAPC